MLVSNRHCLCPGTQTLKTLTLRCRFPGLNAPVYKIASAKFILAPQAESSVLNRRQNANCQKIICTFKTNYFGDRKTALFWRENKFKIEIDLSLSIWIDKKSNSGVSTANFADAANVRPGRNGRRSITGRQSNDRTIDLPIRGWLTSCIDL